MWDSPIWAYNKDVDTVLLKICQWMRTLNDCSWKIRYATVNIRYSFQIFVAVTEKYRFVYIYWYKLTLNNWRSAVTVTIDRYLVMVLINS